MSTSAGYCVVCALLRELKEVDAPRALVLGYAFGTMVVDVPMCPTHRKTVDDIHNAAIAQAIAIAAAKKGPPQ